MFSNVGTGEVLILIAAALIILGPERLPGAVSWTMQSLRKVRDYATGATDQLKNELGADFDDFRKPLADLNELRGMSPRSVVTKHLLNGDDSVFRTDFGLGSTKNDASGTGYSGKNGSGTNGAGQYGAAKSSPQTPPIKPVSKTPKPATPSAATNSAGESTTVQRHNIADWDAT